SAAVRLINGCLPCTCEQGAFLEQQGAPLQSNPPTNGSAASTPGKPPGVECGNQEQALPAETRKGMLWLWVLPGTIGGAMIRRLTENRLRLRVAFHLAVVLVPVATASALAAAFFTGAGDSVLSMLLASMEGSICFAAGYFTLAEIAYRFSSNSPEIEIGDL